MTQESRRTLEFGALPLLEVALKRVLHEPVPMSLPIAFQLADHLRSDFGQILDLGQWEQPPGLTRPTTHSVHSTSGFKLKSPSNGVTVTIQPDMLVARWTKGDCEQYPRFPVLQSLLDRVEAAIGLVVQTELRVDLINVAYANRIDARRTGEVVLPDPWPVSKHWTPPALPDSGQSIDFQSAHRPADGIERRFSVQYRQDAPGVGWYLLLTVAGIPVSQQDNREEKEVAAHDALIDWFPDLLSEQAKKEFDLK